MDERLEETNHQKLFYPWRRGEEKERCEEVQSLSGMLKRNSPRTKGKKTGGERRFETKLQKRRQRRNMNFEDSPR